jgi:hypothetical protein
MKPDSTVAKSAPTCAQATRRIYAPHSLTPAARRALAFGVWYAWDRLGPRAYPFLATVLAGSAPPCALLTPSCSANGLYVLDYKVCWSARSKRIGFLEGNSNQGEALCFEPMASNPASCV